MLSIQQQQHSLLSQASWGRLEMKSIRNTKAPTETQKEHKAKGRERDKQNEEKGHGSGTSIASLQALLSIVSSLEIFHSFKSLLTDSSQVKLGRPLPLFTLSSRFRTPLHTGTSGGLRWTTIMLSIYKLICLWTTKEKFNPQSVSGNNLKSKLAIHFGWRSLTREKQVSQDIFVQKKKAIVGHKSTKK